MYLNALPAELFIEVSENVELASDILCLSLTCKKYYNILLSLLYTNVDLKSLHQCRITLRAIEHDASRSQHIRNLRVRPYYLRKLGLVTNSSEAKECFNEESICRILSTMAQEGKLSSLRELDWDGIGAPLDSLENRMWVKLRNHCKSLTSLAVTINIGYMDPFNPLFDFEGLKSFSLRPLQDVESALPIIRTYHLPDKAWAMLLLRCPDLEHLHLESFIPSSYSLFNFDPVFHANWPRLQSLTLGCFNYPPGSSVHASTAEEANVNENRSPTYYCETFFSRHSSSIEHLTLGWKPNFLQTTMPTPSTGLTHLRSFTGTHEQLLELPNSFESLESLTLNREKPHALLSPQYIRPLCVLLGRLRNLLFLTMTISTISTPDQIEAFRALLEACRGIEELSLASLESFTPAALRSMYGHLSVCTNLRRFNFRHQSSRNDETIFSSAQQIFLDNLNIRSVKLRRIYSGYIERVKIAGTFEVVRSQYGLMGRAEGNERGVVLAREWGSSGTIVRYSRELVDAVDNGSRVPSGQLIGLIKKLTF